MDTCWISKCPLIYLLKLFVYVKNRIKCILLSTDIVTVAINHQRKDINKWVRGRVGGGAASEDWLPRPILAYYVIMQYTMYVMSFKTVINKRRPLTVRLSTNNYR